MKWAIPAAMTLFLFHTAFAQSTFGARPLDTQARDVAWADDGRTAFLAAYDRNEIWRVDGTTGEVTHKGATGAGPVALAVSSDGNTVAAANSVSGDVTLLQASDLTVLATVEAYAGPSAVAALPGGGFAVTCGQAEKVVLVDPADPGRATALDVSGVPNTVAASRDFLVVGTRAPASLRVFRQGSRQPTALPLPSTPTAITASHDRFVVAMKAGTVAVDATRGKIVASSELLARDVAEAPDGVFALTENGLLRLDANLREIESYAVDASARAIAAAGESVAATAPQDRAWFVRMADTPTAAASAPVEAVVASPEPAAAPEEPAAAQAPEPLEPVAPAPAPETVVEEAQVVAAAPEEPAQPTESPLPATPTSEESTKALETPVVAPAKVVEQRPLAEPIPIVADEAPALPASPVLTESEPLPQDAPAQDATAQDEDIRPPSDFYQRRSLGPMQTQAPRASEWRPSAVPIPRDSQSGFGEAFSGIGFGQGEGGFRQPNLDVLKNVNADQSQIRLNPEGGIESLDAEGNVSLKLEDMDFASDFLYYSQAEGRMEARGGVSITQDLSTLNADELYYRMPTEEQAAQASPPVEGEDPMQKRFAMGEFEAKNISIVEPARELEAARIHYNFAEKTGEIVDFRGRAGIYYFGGHAVRVLGPADASGEDVWITTCNLDPPHYRIRIRKAQLREGEVVMGRDARLQLGGVDTPVYWPRWAHSSQDRSFNFDFDSGHSAEIGYYVNLGQRFTVTPDVDLGIRLFPTTHEGVGFGLETYYDFTETPASPLYRAEGQVRTLYTTKDRGQIEAYHRQDLFDDAVLRLQWEQWSDRDFYKDFYYEAYRDRTAPRTFANLTYDQPEWIATATVRKTTNSFVNEPERLPEVTYHLLERRLAENLYFSFDTINGYNEREFTGAHAARSVNVARLTYDWRISQALSLTPFIEGEASWYSDRLDEKGAAMRLSALSGATLQSRFYRNFPGIWNFSGFKHVVVPSITFSYRPESTLDVVDTPRFDDYDNVYGRARLESKVDNILFGRDTITKDVWQVARLTLYQGSDLWNEFRTSEDYEMEMDLRPRPWWGWLLAAEHHGITNDYDLDQPFFLQNLFLETYDRLFDEPPNPETTFRYNAQYGDYDRLLTYLYYDNRSIGGKLNGRLGFAYTETLDEVFNREVLYGAGYRLGEHWGVAFEQRYDFERGELSRQEYEISRDLHCWEATVQVRDRESGWDFGLELSIKAFPGTAVKF